MNYPDFAMSRSQKLQLVHPIMKKAHAFWSPLGAAALVLIALAWNTPVSGAVDNNPPDRMTYQSFLVDNTGTALGNTAPKNYDVVFRIWSDATATDVTKRLWSETQTVTVDKGYFSVVLGEGSVVSGEPRPALSTLFYAADASDRYIEMSVTGVGVLAPRLRLMPSPYAFLSRYASYANTLVNTSNSPVLSINGSSIAINRGLTPPASTLDVNGGITATNLIISNNIQVSASSWIGMGLTNTFSYDSKPMGLNSAAWMNDTSDTTGPTMWLSANSGFKFFTAGLQPAVLINKLGDLAARRNITASNTITASNFVGNGTIPIGGIIMWSGQIANIPAGWALCNGSNSTPNLTDRFIYGAGGKLTPNVTNGSMTKVLKPENLPPHVHSYTDSGFVQVSADWSSGGSWSDGDGTGRATSSGSSTGNGPGTSTPVDIMPPYYTLAFIMRIK